MKKFDLESLKRQVYKPWLREYFFVSDTEGITLWRYDLDEPIDKKHREEGNYFSNSYAADKSDRMREARHNLNKPFPLEPEECFWGNGLAHRQGRYNEA